MVSGVGARAGADRPNLIGIHCLVWAAGTSPAEVAVAARQTEAAGYGLLELSLHDAGHLDVAAARGALEAAGLAVACSRGLAFDADVSSADTAVVERGTQLLRSSLELAHGVGAGWLTGVLYSALGKYRQPVSGAGRRNAAAALRELASQAQSWGITVGLEVVNRYETHVINTAADAMRLVDEIGSDNVMIHLDTYHMHIEESSLAGAVREVGARLGYVHVGENHRGYLGSGQIDFRVFFRALAEVGYGGPITFESFSSAVVAPGLSADLAVWRDLWSDGCDLAIRAHSFMSSQLRAVGL